MLMLKRFFVFLASEPILMKLVLAAALAATLVACGGDSSPTSNPTAAAIDRAAAASTWQLHDIDSYQVTLTRECFCLPRGEIVLTVQDGLLVDSLVVEENRSLTVDELEYIPGTVEQLFDLITASEAAGDTVAVQYDSAYGYPSRVAINEEALAADGGIIYHLSGFIAAQ